MCGIIGVASTEGMKNRSSRVQFMKMGLDIDSWRGWESTGLALVTQGSNDAPIVYKRALNGRDFIQLHQVDKYLSDIEKYAVAIGHNRAATTGRGNIVDHNAHPFQYGRITLVHNGHIRNTHDLKGAVAGAQCQVDSAHVAFSMDANGELETLEQIDGGYVLVWWNSDAGTLNIARNTERPLHMAFAEKENTFYWASELTELLHLLKDVQIDEEIGILYPKAWNWYKFNLKNLREFEKIPFVKSQGRHSQNMGSSGRAGVGAVADTTIHQGPWTDEDIEAWEAQYGENLSSTIHRDRTTTSTTSKASEEIEEIRQTVANQRLKDAKLSGIPTSKKRIARAKVELRKLGIDYNSLRNCKPISWCKYKNQANLGSVLAQTKRDGFLIEVLQVRNEQFLDFQKAGNLLVDCVNVRNGPNNDIRVIGTVSPRMKDYLERFKARNEARTEKPSMGSIERDCDGPNGTKISMARFLELTDKGCVNCQRDITPKDGNSVIWVGRDEAPVCPDCASDPGIMELLGVPESFRQPSVH